MQHTQSIISLHSGYLLPKISFPQRDFIKVRMACRDPTWRAMMTRRRWIYPFFLLIVSVVIAAEDTGPYRPARTSYRLYGGELGDPTIPSSGDKKVAFSVVGRAAKQIFDAIGPDRPDACTEEVVHVFGAGMTTISFAHAARPKNTSAASDSISLQARVSAAVFANSWSAAM